MLKVSLTLCPFAFSSNISQCSFATFLFHVLLAVKITGSYIAIPSSSLLPSLAILPYSGSINPARGVKIAVSVGF